MYNVSATDRKTHSVVHISYSQFLSLHWSPEQIGLKLEAYPIQISYKTIYRAIYAGMFRGREFQLHGNETKALGVEFYFPPPYQSWQRGTNENTNGLLREYFPKGYDFNRRSDAVNRRPRKCLGYKTPAEVYFSTMLHLV